VSGPTSQREQTGGAPSKKGTERRGENSGFDYADSAFAFMKHVDGA